ncbi:MAG: DNA topoisomerase IB [Patescibacteria group bacterium]
MSSAQSQHTSGHLPGLTRKKIGSKFCFFTANERQVTRPDVIARCESLGIPPAYQHVWIATDPKAHLQATALDKLGRKHYFYHSAWQARLEAAKFAHLLPFASALGAVRRQVNRDLRLRGLPKDKILAAIVRLLDTKYVRVGNEVYAKNHHSYGLTTLLQRHVYGRGLRMHLIFKGKSGVAHDVSLKDERVIKVIAACQDLPGQELFAYLDDLGESRRLYSEDVNHYLHVTTGAQITAKDFRTWHGSVVALAYLARHEASASLTERKRTVVAAVKVAAEALRNTAAVCRHSYIHPKILEHYLSGNFKLPRSLRILRRRYRHLTPDELNLVSLLERV